MSKNTRPLTRKQDLGKLVAGYLSSLIISLFLVSPIGATQRMVLAEMYTNTG
jgi:hypothetical protein